MHFFEKFFGRLQSCSAVRPYDDAGNLAFHNKLAWHKTYICQSLLLSHSKQRLTACPIFMLNYHCYQVTIAGFSCFCAAQCRN